MRRPKALDDPEASIRKLHVAPTPRCGGIAIAVGILLGAAAVRIGGGDAATTLLLLAFVLPGFAGGLLDDFTKKASASLRLLLTAVAAAIGVAVLDARVTQVGVPGVDALLAVPPIAYALTVFGITGLAHAVNVIDGLNGLAGFVALLASIGLAIVAAIVGDQAVFVSACLLASGVAGFLVVNFPRGRIFLGDGGAYLIGLLLGLLSVMLTRRNADVSAWFPLLLLAYPVWETVFSMYRRKLHGRATSRADALHLHSLVYRRLVRWRGYSGTAADYVIRNSLASLVLWTLPIACLLSAVSFWNQPPLLQALALAFAVVYTVAYARLVRLGVPERLVIRSKATPEDVEGASAKL